jgi:iron complex transport system substrate-binding protein
LKEGKSLYHVNEAKLKIAAPNLLVTQNLCQVCGPAGNEVTQVLKTMDPAPHILWQTPKTFDEVLQAYEELGKHTQKEAEAEAWVTASRAKVEEIKAKVQALGKATPTRVAFLEWIDPIYAGGHWVGEMLEWAGGDDVNSRKGTDSVRIDWNDVLEWKPEVIIVSPCGFDLTKSIEQAKLVFQRPGFMDLPAAKEGKIFAVDANGYFARPGIRLVQGLELLAHVIHGPEVFPWVGPSDAFANVPVEVGAGEQVEKEKEKVAVSKNNDLLEGRMAAASLEA